MSSLFVVVLRPAAGGKHRQYYESECACWTLAASAALKANPEMVLERVYQDPISVAGICQRCGQIQQSFPRRGVPLCRDCLR